MKEWHNQKECGSGKIRLLILWHIYKILNKKFFKIILWPIVLFVYIFAKSQRKSSERYIQKLHDEQQRRGLTPSNITPLKHFMAFAESVVDKIEAYSPLEKSVTFKYDEADDSRLFLKLLDDEKGVFIITSHLGSTEVLQGIKSKNRLPHTRIHAFMQTEQSPIFFDFIKKKISEEKNFVLHSIADLDISTSIEIKEKLQNGSLVMITGDRTSAKYPKQSFSKKFLGEYMNFPKGVFKFAQLMESPVFFMICVKNSESEYLIYLKAHRQNDDKKTNLEEMKNSYVSFLEEKTLRHPAQWFNF
ncbi:hypothetical protein FACS189449_08990 [Alphaproteobacteria bacterium]|nr:hypothetical protein FACS189449_08990 [Alphaproteobacteria bacterium]